MKFSQQTTALHKLFYIFSMGMYGFEMCQI